jgi:glutamate racemase
VKSGSYVKAVRGLSGGVTVSSQACPLFVPLVEEGWFRRKVTREVAQEYLRSLKAKRIDTLILGCTHYPLLKGTLRQVMGPRVSLVDSAQEVAGEVKALLNEMNLVNGQKRKAAYRFLVSDDPLHFQKLAKRFLEYNIGKVKKI